MLINKSIEIDLEAIKRRVTRKQMDAMSEEEKAKLMRDTIDNVQKALFAMSFATLKFGKHADECTDEDICNCGLSSLQGLAIELMEYFEPIRKESIN